MKMMHCDANRTERQKVFIETADGKFKYQLFMDYAKGLPESLEMVPYMGNISGAVWGRTTAFTAACGEEALCPPNRQAV